MSELQTIVKHDGDCACYKALIDEDGKIYDCNICDCGALRKSAFSGTKKSSTFWKCWVKHTLLISQSYKLDNPPTKESLAKAKKAYKKLSHLFKNKERIY